MTIPTLMQNTQEKVAVAGLQKFSSTLQQAIQLWKNDIDCRDDAVTCLSQQGLADNVCSNFDQISKFMRVNTKTADKITGTENWLPVQTLDYYGNAQTGVWGAVSQYSTAICGYQLSDGTTFAMDVDPGGFDLFVDVNGKKPPNRMGKDTFPLVIGFKSGHDVYYNPSWAHALRNTQGLCDTLPCDPNNVNPTVGNGANPTAYVILHGKLPDFKKLSETVAGFKP